MNWSLIRSLPANSRGLGYWGAVLFGFPAARQTGSCSFERIAATFTIWKRNMSNAYSRCGRTRCICCGSPRVDIAFTSLR